ncbi:NADH-quinone oxidoreductase subunit D-related protein [Gluconobacter morbifer]|uniref:NADH-quinone oxidoreductase subunit D domain-containing protein n=1 Tax=Gluconobacter morbifer G707 TaxID=1088869 RepID=G6XLC4_9PROT|nr:hypothetical protein [Gluconobacter morbifer]EHH67179.1 hypothetical protein GMO_21720 [Gluconobacter morbifer G707]
MASILRSGERVALSHWHLDAGQWSALLGASGPALPFVSCWADEKRVYVLLLEGDCPLMASTAIEDRRYVAPSSRFPAAEWGERVAYDLYGVEAMASCGEGLPALDEGGWEATWPLSSRPGPAAGMLRPLGGRNWLLPERSGLSGPVGLSFDVVRSRVEKVRISAGLAHRGILARIMGKTPEEALPVISRVTAGGFVAHPLAFVRAVAQARGLRPGPGVRDCWMLLAEIERISMHLFDMARTARAMDAGILATHCDHAREAVALACQDCGVPRRLTDVVTCDGFRVGLEPVPLAQAVHDAVAPRLTGLRELCRVFGPRLRGVAVLTPQLAEDFAVGGVTGRASGRALDMRRREAGMRLDALRSTGASAGDAEARDAVRLSEIRDSLTLIERILASIGMDDDEPAPEKTDEGIGVAEGPRGDVWYWVRLKNGRIDGVQSRDPGVSLLPVLGRMLRGHPPEMLSLALESVALSPAGVAL